MLCAVCHKKLALSSAFDCSCLQTFCIKHLLREEHSCLKLTEMRVVKLAKVVADKVPNRL
jgi:predicted nucleic acid binding AN1-type Zn finger protein